MKIISWNINGIRAAAGKGLAGTIIKLDADVVCLQEIKADESVIPYQIKNIPDYTHYWFPAKKKGYGGVATLTKYKPLTVTYGIGIKKFDEEGRVLVLEYEEFYLINTYFPNSQPKLVRLDYKLEFNNAFLKFIDKLRKHKPVIFCGDLNVAHTEIDLKNPKQNMKNPGFYIEERNWFTKMLEHGYIDTFRMFNKEPGHYTWWSYRFNARARNIGWRIDYFIVSEELKDKVKSSVILDEIKGSDHCPIMLEIQ